VLKTGRRALTVRANPDAGNMRLRFKVIALLVAGFAILVSLLIVGLVTLFRVAAPPSWHQVHVGMQRTNILALVGSAQASGYPEKIVETWHQDGALGLRKLEVWY